MMETYQLTQEDVEKAGGIEEAAVELIQRLCRQEEPTGILKGLARWLEEGPTSAIVISIGRDLPIEAAQATPRNQPREDS